MKRFVIRPLVIVLVLSHSIQGCAPRDVTKENDFQHETEETRGATPEDAKEELRAAMEKADPIDVKSRRELSTLLHSIRRVAAGKIETDYEVSLAKRWDGLTDDERQYALDRINYFCAMPMYLQKKYVDESFFTTKMSKSLSPLTYEAESAGIVCGESDVIVCPGQGQSGKLQMPEGSQGIALDPARPLVFVADGSSGLLLVNVSAPANPTYFPTSPYSGNNTGFVNDVLTFKRGANTYTALTSSKIAASTGTLELVDVSNPMATLTTVGKLAGDYYKITLSDDQMWAFSYNGSSAAIDIVNLSDLAAPAVVTSVGVTGDVSDISFISDMIHILLEDGSSVFYSFDLSSGVPQLYWAWGPDGFPCAGGDQDDKTEILRRGDLSLIVKNNCAEIVRTVASGIPTDTGIWLTDTHRHNSGTFLDDNNVVIDFMIESEIRDVGSGTINCQFGGVKIFRIPEVGPAQLEQVTTIELPNEINGIAARDDVLYLADLHSTRNCKRPGQEPPHFRVIATPKTYVEYQDITPTIETINGTPVYQDPSEMPTVMCGSQAVFCGFVGATGNECDPTGICVGGVCAQPPVLEVDGDQTLVLTGNNYWDVNAKVLIQNFGSNSWVSFDAVVYGDEFCEFVDRMKVQIDASVSFSGHKRIKIRNFNTVQRLRTCVDCQDLDSPQCIPDFVESNEIVIYFRDVNDITEPGYDLTITKIQAKQGSNGAWDLGKRAWYDDETAVVAPDPGDGSATFWIPDEDGFEFQHNGEYEDLSTQIAFRDTYQSDAVESPMIKLWETDDSRALGAALLGGGLSCAGLAYKTEVCGPYTPGCVAVCLGVALVGALMVIFDGGDWIASESDIGLVMTKEIARDVLQHGQCALPGSWESNSSVSENSVISVSDLIMIGGLKTRYIVKQYVCKECPKTTKNDKEWGGKYWLTYRLTERQ